MILKALLSSSRYSILVPNYIIWMSLLTYMATVANELNINALALGLACWSFWEYVYHRWAMHGLENTKFYQILHGYHHSHPEKPSHIPSFQYFLVAPIFFAVAHFYNPAHVFSYSVGHTFGLGCFEYMHYKIHKVVPPHDQEAYVRYHMHHHKVSHKKAHCFTSPFFDIIFGTFPYSHFTFNPMALLPIPYIAFYGVSQHKK